MKTNLTAILEVARPTIENMLEGFKGWYQSEYGKLPSEYKVSDYELQITYDMVNAIGRYIQDTDEINSISISEVSRANNSVLGGHVVFNGKLVLSCMVKRDGISYLFESDIISAGGYNIQCLHIRYIIKTELRSKSPNSLVSYYAEKIKVKKQIATIERKIEERTKQYISNKNHYIKQGEMSDADILKQHYLDRVYFWENICKEAQEKYGTKEAFIQHEENEKKESIRKHKKYASESLVYQEQSYNKDIKKYNLKLEALKKSL